MADIKLIACDMDGTLLNSNKQLTEENIRAVKRLKEAGGSLCNRYRTS